LNQAAVEKLPLVLVVANNQYAYSTPTRHQFACRSLADRAVGYGFTAQQVDGTDLSVCLRVVGQAVERARSGAGPQMVVAELLRLCGHGEHDDASYIDPLLRQAPIGRDCLKVAEEFLLRHDFADSAAIAVWRSEAIQETEQAIATAQREGSPDPFAEDWSALSTRHLIESRGTDNR
jgi:pyruvate dehydrogenase E1 component alpha subunit/2-oxoisovalerate dehydrogenase E1 component alpha subunit